MTAAAKLRRAAPSELQQALLRAGRACEKAATALQHLSNELFDLKRSSSPERFTRTLPAIRNAAFSALCELANDVSAATTAEPKSGEWGEAAELPNTLSRVAWLVALGGSSWQELEEDAKWVRGFVAQFDELARGAR